MASYRHHQLKRARFSTSEGTRDGSVYVTGALNCPGCFEGTKHVLGQSAQIEADDPSCDILSHVLRDVQDRISSDPELSEGDATHEPLTMVFDAKAVHKATL